MESLDLFDNVGRWLDDCTLLNLPYTTKNNCKLLKLLWEDGIQVDILLK